MIILIGVITFIPYVYEFLVPDQEDVRAERAAIEKLILVETLKKKEWVSHKIPVKGVVFDFDPNHVSQSDWQRLGLSVKQAAVMIRYRAKGGKFRKKEDLQKMYPISPELYARLIPYIHISSLADSTSFKKPFKYPAITKRQPVMVSINSADTLALDEVKGIGPAFARRIVKYRDRLGGFCRKEQLLEVFGLDSIKYREIKDQVTVDVRSLKKININRVEFAGLQHHPYLNFRQINAILQFRKQHGNYGNIADLKKVAILSAETIEKLAPYISFDHD